MISCPCPHSLSLARACSEGQRSVEHLACAALAPSLRADPASRDMSSRRRPLLDPLNHMAQPRAPSLFPSCWPCSPPMIANARTPRQGRARRSSWPKASGLPTRLHNPIHSLSSSPISRQSARTPVPVLPRRRKRPSVSSSPVTRRRRLQPPLRHRYFPLGLLQRLTNLINSHFAPRDAVEVTVAGNVCSSAGLVSLFVSSSGHLPACVPSIHALP
jgi:hypothetical protein